MLGDSQARMAEADLEPRAASERRAPSSGKSQGLDSLRAEVQRKLAQQIDLGLPDPFPPAQQSDPTFRPKAERQRIDSLRAEAQRNMTTRPEVKRPAMFARSGLKRGPKPSRIALVGVALVAGGLAAYLALHGGSTPTPPVQVAARPAPQIVAAPTSAILVAKQTIEVGQRITDSDVQWADWPQADLRAEYVTKASAPDAIQRMGGQVARFAIFAGEPIRSDKLAEGGTGYLSSVLGQGMRAVSVGVTPEAASGGFIVPNDRVDVLVTRNTASGPVSDTVVHNALVLAIGKKLGTADNAPNPGEAGSDAFSGQTLATLAVDGKQAQVLTSASATGKLSLVLRSLTDFTSTAEAEQAANAAIRLSSPFWTSGTGSAPPTAR